MGYSVKDIENAGKNVKKTLDERSQRRAQEVADSITINIDNGGGVLAMLGRIFSRWFSFIGAYMLLVAILSKVFPIDEGISVLIAFVGAIIAIRNDYIWNSPFQSAVALWAGALILFVVFT